MTHASVDREDLGQEIKSVLNNHFGGLEIESVEILTDLTDPDLADEIELTVIFRGTTDDLVRNCPAGVIEILADLLTRIRRDAFPILSFKSSDAHS